jgi:hypothetical protein
VQNWKRHLLAELPQREFLLACPSTLAGGVALESKGEILMKQKISLIVMGLGVMLVVLGCASAASTPTTETTTDDSTTPVSDSCIASPDWVSNPEGAPDEVPMGENAHICQFHQFSWQWFIALLNDDGSGNRVYENQQDYPLLLIDQNSCAATNVERQLFVRNGKNDNGSEDDFVLPERINQAGSESIIYDQNGNVVYYEVRFSRNECSLDSTAMMFPAGTTELKVSWRVITEADKSNYVWINADINNDGTVGADELLGMVGFHLVRSTELHPEFIWATFEHKQNAPNCQTTPTTTEGWSFARATCAGQLPNSVDPSACAFNKPPTPPTPAPLSGGTPSEICQVYQDGSRPGDNQYDTNVAAIDQLNEELTGPNGYITVLPVSNPLAVLQNYKLVGALWENDVTLPSSDLSNQRGSIQLANTTMETTEQQGFSELPYTGTSNLQPAANCFACHNYQPGNNVALSHIFKEIFGPSN